MSTLSGLHLMAAAGEIFIRVAPRRVQHALDLKQGISCVWDHTAYNYTENDRRTRARMEIAKWIDTHTSGNFWLGDGLVVFEDEQDAVMFKLGYNHE